ncbi:hypothetical protein [Streptomyces sp.]|uniref:hypothetical protein n=1 Tax=Streptomyces sp. TaxID=1931 RepID=UPI002F95DC3C
MSQETPEVLIVEVDTTAPDELAVIVRCLATTRLGAHFLSTTADAHPIDLRVTEIRRYPTVPVEEVTPPHAARLILTAPAAHTVPLNRGDILRGANPPVPQRRLGT